MDLEGPQIYLVECEGSVQCVWRGLSQAEGDLEPVQPHKFGPCQIVGDRIIYISSYIK